MDQVKCDESLQMHCREWKESLTAMMSENDTCFIAKEQRAATSRRFCLTATIKRFPLLSVCPCVFSDLCLEPDFDSVVSEKLVSSDRYFTTFDWF